MANNSEIALMNKLQDAVGTFSEELQTLQKNMNQSDSEFDRAAKSANEYAKNIGVGMTAAIAQLGVVAWNTANEYDKALKSIQLSTGSSGRELQAMEGSFRSIMQEVPNAAAEVAGTIANLDSYTEASGGTMDSLARQILDLSRMLKENGAGNAKAFGQALSQWQRPAEDASTLLDGMFKISQHTGIGFGQLATDLNSYGGAMQHAGFSMEETADFFGHLNAQGIATSKVMPGLNKTFQQWAGEQKNSRQELAKTMQAMQGAESSADALAIATDAFGQDSAQQMVTVARSGAFALADLGSSFEGVGGSIARYADETMTLDDKMQRLKNQLFQVLEPYGEKMIEQAEKAVDYFEQNGPEMIAIAEDVAKAIAGIGIAAGTIKMGKGIADVSTFIGNLAKVGKETAKTGAGVGGVSASVRILGTVLRGLTGPVGWAIAGVGLLSAGWTTYKKHQEDARQELIHMGDDLEEVSSHYDIAAEKATKTNDLVWEYEHLHEIVNNNTDATRDLSTQKERLAEIEQILQDMYPDRISQYDIENGKINEKLELLKREKDAERDLSKLKLEKEVAEKRRDLPKLEEEIASLELQTEELWDQRTAIENAIPAFKEFQVEFEEIMDMQPSDERTELLDDLQQRANEVGQTVGYSFIGYNHLEQLDKKIDELSDEEIDNLDEYIKKYEELKSATASYKELYDQQLSLLELDLGGTIESMMANYSSLTDEQKVAVDLALANIEKLNENMGLMQKEYQIDVNVLFKQAGLVSDLRLAQQYYPSIPIPEGYADGGFSDRPAIFGEAGLEAAIPINNKPRSHAILDRVNHLMGHDTSGSMQVTFAPNIRLAVGGSTHDVRSQVQSAIRESQVEFERRFREMVQQERRLSFHA